MIKVMLEEGEVKEVVSLVLAWAKKPTREEAPKAKLKKVWALKTRVLKALILRPKLIMKMSVVALARKNQDSSAAYIQ